MIAVLLAAGCDDDSFLGGKWVPTQLTAGDGGGARAFGAFLGRCPTGDTSEACELFVDFSLGHYGDDVVGVVRYYENESRQREVVCAPDDDVFCSCMSIRGKYNEPKFDFQLTDCHGLERNAQMVRKTSDQVELVIFDAPAADCPGKPDCTTLRFDLEKTLNEDQLTPRDIACTACQL